MTTKEFITKAFNGETEARKCSSVFRDSNNDVYSYGYHYPLLFRVNGKAIRNVRGYSSTTGRHILWSRDVDAIDIHTLSTFRLIGSSDDIIAELVQGQKQHIASLETYMSNKKQKNTAVYANLERLHADAVANLAKLEA